jgi:hypothetical protein
MAIEKDNAHEVAGNWAPPNVEGKDPHAAFSLFLVHVKKILRPAELGYLLRPLMQPLANKEMSIIDIRDAVREICGAERTIVQDRLAALTTAVEVYAKANRSNPFLFERLGWMVHGLTIWEPHILARGDITFTNEEHLKELSEGFRMDERYHEAGISADEKAMEVAIADGFVKAVFRTDELRAAVVERLKGIATSIALDPIPNNGTTATKGTPERLKWKSSTAAFAHIFNTLAQEGYFDLPRKGGKENDPNFTGFARVLLQAFDVKGEDGNSLTPEQLRVRLRPSAPRPLAETKTAKFQIPDKGILIVPNADEMK